MDRAEIHSSQHAHGCRGAALRYRRPERARNASRSRQHTRPPRCSTGFHCSSTATPTARHIYIRPSGEHRFTVLDDLNETYARAARRRMASIPAPSSRPAPATFRPGSSTPLSCRSSIGTFAAQTLGQVATMPIQARRTGDGSDGFPASPTANPNTASSDGLFPFVRLKSHSGQQYRDGRGLRSRRSRSSTKRENRSGRRGVYEASLSPQRGPRLSNLSLEQFRTSDQVPGPARRRGHRVLCRRLCQWHDRGPDRTCP